LLSQHSIAPVALVHHLVTTGIADHVGRPEQHLLMDVERLTALGTFATLAVDVLL
jgi:hypothetical protein